MQYKLPLGNQVASQGTSIETIMQFCAMKCTLPMQGSAECTAQCVAEAKERARNILLQKYANDCLDANDVQNYQNKMANAQQLNPASLQTMLLNCTRDKLFNSALSSHKILGSMHSEIAQYQPKAGTINLVDLLSKARRQQ